MSRMGKRPVAFDGKVKVDYKDRNLHIKGPKGELNLQVPPQVEIELAKDEVTVKADFDNTQGKMFSGTVRSLINNMVIGVSQGFEKKLELVGVGYRAQVKGQTMVFSLGYSHPIEYQLPKSVSAQVDANTKITLQSCDKQLLGQVCAEIRKFRPPEPYKGKGILFAGEQILRKAGKTAKGSK